MARAQNGMATRSSSMRGCGGLVAPVTNLMKCSLVFSGQASTTCQLHTPLFQAFPHCKVAR